MLKFFFSPKGKPIHLESFVHVSSNDRTPRSSGSIVDNTLDYQSMGRKINPLLVFQMELKSKFQSPYNLVVGAMLNSCSLTVATLCEVRK